MTLDDILSKEEPQKVEVVEAEKPKEPVKAPERDESGRFAKGEEKAEKAPPKVEKEPKAEKPAEPEKPEEDEGATPAPKKEESAEEPDQVRGLKAAHMAEKTKRQEYERRLAELERQIQESKAQAPKPDPFSDPDGFSQHMTSQMQALQQQLERKAMDDRLNLSEMIARQAHPDLDEVFQVFQEEATNNPALGRQALDQQHPWEWVYQQGRKLKLMREIGEDPDAWRNAERERLKAELQQMQEKQAKEAPPSPPPSLASVNSAPVREQSWGGPRSLNQILKR